MAVFKCKMCGGSLEVTEGTTVCECEYCGTKQTLPKSGDDATSRLFNRANHLRMKCEFDKAQEIYEKIVSTQTDDAEAYWGLVLCKFGIEYVEDPGTFRKIPTCHRTQLDSILADMDYQSALKYADPAQKELYEAEAKEIDRLQKNILDIVRKEKPFDVFICYKETDEDGKRTQDSVIANDIYYQLTQEGFKVFYAAITLEDKLGQEYEPYIFAALSSAKVMLAIGTKPEYFSAVWVRNEWSRFLKLMKQDRKKQLIPCYRDMDAYDMPEEFSHLQAQDMSKIGFINDLVRGIRKIIHVDVTDNQTSKTVVVSQTSTNLENLLKRGYLSLENQKWEDANKFFEQILDENVEESRAYIGKFLAELHLTKEKGLEDYHGLIEKSENYRMIIRFGDSEKSKQITECVNRANYNYGVHRMKNARKDADYIEAEEIFHELGNYADSKEKEKECGILKLEYHNKCDYQYAVNSMKKAKTDIDYRKAKALFQKIIDYSNSKEMMIKCEQMAMEYCYQKAMKTMQYAETENDYQSSAEEFKKILPYKDAKNQVDVCLKLANDEKLYQEAIQLYDEGQLGYALKNFEQIENYKDSISRAGICRTQIAEIERMREYLKKRKKNNKIAIILFIILYIIFVIGFALFYLISEFVK